MGRDARRLLAFGLVGAIAAVLVGKQRRAAAAPAPSPRGRTSSGQDDEAASREPQVTADPTTDETTPTPSPERATGEVPIPTLDEWAVLLAPICVEHDIQLPFALKWIEEESGGNPCEVGYPPAHGGSGPWTDYPLEMGIAQFYNPDDLDALGLTAPALRAYCEPGDRHEVIFRGRKVVGFSQRLVRSLTRDEMREQAQGTIGLITKSMSKATSDLLGVRAGTGWSRTRRDYWRLVKLQHGLPELSRDGLPAVARLLGRAPRSWDEFKGKIGKVTLGSLFERKYRKEIPRILANAEEAASVFSEASVA